MKSEDIRKAVNSALKRHQKFGAGSAYSVSAESALQDALEEVSGEFRLVGLINGPATVKNMTKAAREAWPSTKRPAHRPVSVGGRRVNVTLDEATIERAREIGDGNLSAGIRLAVAQAGGQ